MKKKKLKGSVKSMCISPEHNKIACKISEKIGLNLLEELRSQCTYFIYIFIVLKNEKAHLQTMIKTPVKFQKKLYEELCSHGTYYWLGTMQNMSVKNVKKKVKKK